MSGVDTRHINRDSLFLMADIRLEGDTATHRVKVRNLSAAGMMAEGDLPVLRGTRMTVELRNLPPVDGSVAWVQDQRFGIAFAREIDPKAPRPQVGGNGDLDTPRYVRPSTIAPPGTEGRTARLRNI
ncbi:PilZ domain-containing protein [Tsuneonella amylolytica]|uniref:PilZ domain-containing protein n=1 Tax=Tsuneonella amylolytica TaxID=2338327 RepID=UPI000EAA21C6|nr:PilZ domain-containing protein [Tsuneonella amylolytica]